MKKVAVNTVVQVLCITLIFISGCTAQDNSLVSNDILKENTKDDQKAQEDENKDKSSQLGRNIFTIFEDSYGNIWIGADNKGVARYNGKDLKYYTAKDGLAGKTVANIAEDKDGMLWFGTYSDVCKIDLKAYSNSREINFINFEKDPDGVPFLGYGWKRVQTNRSGNLWLNSHHGIYQYNGSEFIEFKTPMHENLEGSFCNTPGSISMDLEDSKGNLWFGTDGDGAYKYDGNTFTHFTKEDGLTSDNVTSILEDKDGNIWFTCRTGLNHIVKEDGGICSYDGKDFTKYLDQKGLYDNNVHTIYRDKKDNLWIGATGVGVYKYDGNTFKLYKEPKGVDYTDNFNISGLQCMLEDSKGRLWMGFSGGLYRLEGETIINVKENGPWE